MKVKIQDKELVLDGVVTVYDAAREAELQLYEHNVEYKCNPALYRKIYDMIIENCN